MEHEPTIARTLQRIDALGQGHAQRSIIAQALARAHYAEREREQAQRANEQQPER